MDISIDGDIEELKHQDYHGKSIKVKIEDQNGTVISSKIDIGVHMFFRTKDNVNLHYVDTGNRMDSVPVVLVPGWGYSVRVFEKLILRLSENRRVIALDPRGHGQSDATDEGIDFQQQAKDLSELLEELRLPEVILIGWSYGAYAVWGMIREIGLDKIKGVVTIDQPPRATGDDKTEQEKVWVEYMPENIERARAGLSTKEGYRMGVENFARNAAFTGGISEEEVIEFSSMADMPYALAVKEFFAGAECDFTEEAVMADRCEDCKTMMFIRESWSEIACEYMNKICSNTELCVLGGHMMFCEYEDEFVEALQNVLMLA